MLSSNLCFVTRMQDINLEKEAGSSSGSIRTSDHELGTPPSPPPPPPDNHLLQRLRSGGGGSLGIDSSEIIEVRKLPSSQYKGVVPQPNGRWGAQIYEKHHRVWLGTFNDEVDAAKAYDIAAQRFRGRDAVINFSPLSDRSESESDELVFLNSHSKAEIVDMLRKHTYQDELQQSQRRRSLLISIAADTNCGFGDRSNRVPYQPRLELLFEKAVTPSDVGKLNRLVIPKQHAERHFPLKSTEISIPSNRGSLLNLEDAGGKVWRFRYSYWNSSQSYVLTKGWSRFVKEKRLTAGDVVGFYRSVGPDEKLYIDWKPKNSTGGGCYPYLVLPVPVPKRQVAVVKLFGVNIANGVQRRGEEQPNTSTRNSALDPCEEEWNQDQKRSFMEIVEYSMTSTS